MYVKRMAIVKIIIQGRAGHFIDKKKKKKANVDVLQYTKGGVAGDEV